MLRQRRRALCCRRPYALAPCRPSFRSISSACCSISTFVRLEQRRFSISACCFLSHLLHACRSTQETQHNSGIESTRVRIHSHYRINQKLVTWDTVLMASCYPIFPLVSVVFSVVFRLNSIRCCARRSRLSTSSFRTGSADTSSVSASTSRDSICVTTICCVTATR